VGADEFVELYMHRLGVAVLGVLDEEDHQKGDDGRAGIDHELPSVAEVEKRAGNDLDDDNGDRQEKCDGIANPY
jgi:hypothetical protein